MCCIASCALLTACSTNAHQTTVADQSSSNSRTWLDRKLHPDLWQVINRSEKLQFDINQKDIQTQIRHYTANPNTIPTLANNAKPYLYYVYQQTQQQHMPVELALLPMVESNYNPFLYSSRGATGLWQIMPGTASGFNLDINWWYDGRRDIRASTQAAFTYLKYLHDYFDDWLLAIAAYNCGEGTVIKAIHHNKALHKPTDFWSLSLPYQTKNYLPKLLALVTIIDDPAAFNIDLPSIPNQPYFTSVDMSGQIDFSLIAKLADMSPQSVRLLNPGYRRFATAPVANDSILLPVAKAAEFSEKLGNHADKKVHWQHYTVKAGDSLSGIAHRYHTKVSVIETSNNLHSSTIHPNQDLLIPLTSTAITSITPNHATSSIAEDQLPGPTRVKYTVRQHDTLDAIAKRYHVSKNAICFWNHCSTHQTLQIGKTLTIWQSHPTTHQQQITYTVKAGDSLSTIAHHYHTNTKHLQSLNHLHGSLIKVNQKLIIVPGQSHTAFKPRTSNEMIIHTVQAGESISTIAHHYHVTSNQIAQWNHLKNIRLIHSGQKLHIYPRATT